MLIIYFSTWGMGMELECERKIKIKTTNHQTTTDDNDKVRCLHMPDTETRVGF